MDKIEELFLKAQEDFYTKIDINGGMENLSHREYYFLYKSLKYNDLILYSDTNHEVNIVFRIDSMSDFEALLKQPKSLNIIDCMDGPTVQINILNYKKAYKYSFNLKNEKNIYYLKQIIMNKFINVHLIIYDPELLIKLTSVKYYIDADIIEDLKYVTELSYTKQYPRILTLSKDIEGYFITLNNEIEILEELLDIVDKLGKLRINECFDIYFNLSDELKLIFSNEITYKSFNFFKNEISTIKHINSIGKGICFGKPFLRYDKGKMYFLVTSLEASKLVTDGGNM